MFFYFHSYLINIFSDFNKLTAHADKERRAGNSQLRFALIAAILLMLDGLSEAMAALFPLRANPHLGD